MIGERIRELRENRRWSQEFLARRSGIDRRLISKLETGAIKSARLEVAIKLAHAFGVSAELLGR